MHCECSYQFRIACVAFVKSPQVTACDHFSLAPTDSKTNSKVDSHLAGGMFNYVRAEFDMSRVKTAQ